MSVIQAAGAGETSSGLYTYTIDQSLRFEPADNPYLSKTFSSSGGTIFTLSCWVKIADQKTSRCLLQGYSNASNFAQIVLYGGSAATDGWVGMYSASGGSAKLYMYTQALLRDPSAWYHIVVKFNGTSGSEEFKIYINGENQTLTTSTALTAHQSNIGNANAHYIGNNYNQSLDMDGYLAEYNFVDGTALDADSFGETKSGIWVPKEYTGSYGTNGFHLDFADTSAFGDDESGNGNDFAVSGVTAVDQVEDSPTNNFCTYNVLDRQISYHSAQFLSQGNLNLADWKSTEAALTIGGTMAMRSGKWYFECCRIAAVNTSYWGIIREDIFVGQSNIGNTGISAGEYGYSLDSTGYRRVNGTGTSSWGSTYAQDDVFQCAYDADTGKVWFGKNNTWQGSGDPANGTNEAATVDSPSEYGYKIWTRVIGDAFSYEQSTLNCGQDSTFKNQITAGGNSDENGIGDFKYAPPSGFLAICSSNLADPAIDPAKDEDPADYFDIQLWTGTGSGQTFSNFSFQPDWLWFKNRNGGSDHAIFDSIRGVNAGLSSNSSGPQNTNASASQDLVSFDSDGFTTGTPSQYGSLGSNTLTIVTWAWKGGGTANTNNDGTIESSVSASPESGFSIVKYTGTASSGTVGHGLSQAPELVIWKDFGTTVNWLVQGDAMGAAASGYIMLLNSTGSSYANSNFNTTLGASTITLDAGGTNYNRSGGETIAYCFHSVEGYQKIGTYTGNGNADGAFVYTGFKPAFIIYKETGNANNWIMLDNKRDPDNVVGGFLYPNLSNAEATGYTIVDFLSNGFKHRSTATSGNRSGGSYIYIAIADQPFKYANAR